jgi:osmotically-inducible protein OsmY
LVVLLLSCARYQPTPLRSDAHDRSVERAVTEAFSMDSTLAAHPIAIDLEQGIVLLEGAAASLLARRRAELVARTVRGVRGVVNLIRVDPPLTTSDAELQHDVAQALRAHPATRSERISVTVTRGEATLRGGVYSHATARLAARIAERVEGLRAVHGDFEIGIAHAAPSDAALQAMIEERLDWDPYIDAGLVQVRVGRGQVVLAGTVGHAEERKRAIEAADVRGAASVNADTLEVAVGARELHRRTHPVVGVTDRDVLRALRFALIVDPRVHAAAVDVQVSDGHVTLHGAVDDVVAKSAAGADAVATIGVKGVRNLLAVAHGGGRLELERRSATRQDTLQADLHLDPPRATVLAWCQQQERCGFIGPRGPYRSTLECTRRVRDAAEAALRTLECTAGVNEDAVAACVVELRTTDCALPFELERQPSCKAHDLCRVSH